MLACLFVCPLFAIFAAGRWYAMFCCLFLFAGAWLFVICVMCLCVVYVLLLLCLFAYVFFCDCS